MRKRRKNSERKSVNWTWNVWNTNWLVSGFILFDVPQTLFFVVFHLLALSFSFFSIFFHIISLFVLFLLVFWNYFFVHTFYSKIPEKFVKFWSLFEKYRTKHYGIDWRMINKDKCCKNVIYESFTITHRFPILSDVKRHQ